MTLLVIHIFCLIQMSVNIYLKMITLQKIFLSPFLFLLFEEILRIRAHDELKIVHIQVTMFQLFSSQAPKSEM